MSTTLASFFAALLATPLSLVAETITLQGNFSAAARQVCTPYGGSCNVGVDLEIEVNPDGSQIWGISQFADSGTWSIGGGMYEWLFPSLPAGSTIRNATFTFSEPTPDFLAVGLEPELTATASTTFDYAGFLEDGCPDGILRSYGGAPSPDHSIHYVPCSASSYLFLEFGGAATVQLTNVILPETPGSYYNSLYLYESIDYSLTVDYTSAVPEPGSLAMAGAAILGILAIKMSRWRRVRTWL